MTDYCIGVDISKYEVHDIKDNQGKVIETNERTVTRDGLFNIKRIQDKSKTQSKGSKNGSIVKAAKSY